MELKIIDSMSYVGYIALVKSAKLALKKLDMRFRIDKFYHGGLEYEFPRITGKNKEYEIRRVDENEDEIGFGGHYNHNHSLWLSSKLILTAMDYACWNKHDETIKVESYTQLYQEDELGRTIFEILKEVKE